MIGEEGSETPGLQKPPGKREEWKSYQSILIAVHQ
jgi:hypothetical protein